MLQFNANQKQRKALEGLAYWIADRAYIAERYGNDDPEITTCAETIKSIFDECDRLAIPYWVQNAVIIFAENWRHYKTEYLDNVMKSRKIYL